MEKIAELKTLIEELLIKIKAGQKPEFSYLELKQEWINLDKKLIGEEYSINVSKFMRELGALANSYGPWAKKLVFGLSESGVIKDSPFSHSGLKDYTELHGLVVKNVNKPIRFEIYELTVESKTLTIIEVPPSLNKPHIMYQNIPKKGERQENYTPIRRTTGIFPATREDYDLMYWDRQNISPEYALDIRLPQGRFNAIANGGSSRIDFPMVLENYGRKPMIITSGELRIPADRPLDIKQDESFDFVAYNASSAGLSTNEELIQKPIIISANAAVSYTCFFSKWGLVEELLQKKFSFYVVIRDVHGNEFKSGVHLRP